MLGRFLVALNMLVLGCDLARSESAARDLDPEQAFVVALQQAVRSGDAKWIGDHLHLPMRYFGPNTQGKAQMVKSKTWFVKNYPSLIGEKLRRIVLAQEPDKLFRNAQGSMIGTGPNIWFYNFGAGPENIRYEIITINNDDRR